MGNERWKKAKQAMNCLQTRTLDDDHSTSSSSSSSVNSTVRGLSENEDPSTSKKSAMPPLNPTTSSSSSKVSRFFKTLPKFSSKKKTCGICQNRMIKGQGDAIFIAECSHYFHHNCVTSNARHGNRVCPVCRAKWTAIPFQIRTPNPPENLRANFVSSNTNYQQLQDAQPGTYDDDEDLMEHQSINPGQVSDNISDQIVKITTFPDFPAIPKSVAYGDFTILINLKALIAGSQSSRPPVDLVTVVDVSSSMAGPKLTLLKRAMGIVIQNLGPHDRLSVIAFSSVARRLFPLSRMTDTGRHQAVQAVNSLVSNGGTDIAEGLRTGVKVILERKSKNPVSGIILFSDGLDTYTITGPSGTQSKSLVPNSIQQIPVHTFGFGADHDVVSMELISESSGGSFSFIGDEGVVEEAIEHSMGGLLTVVTQEVTVSIECVDPSLELRSIEAGSCRVVLADDVRSGVVHVGDLYAQEERDFLVTMDIPESSDNEMILLKINCTCRYPLTYDLITVQEIEVRIDRTGEKAAWPLVGSIEVDRQRNRVRAAKAMSAARNAAERGEFGIAKPIVERCREMMSASISVRAGDEVSVGLVKELREMRERMANRQVYEASERGYVVSGQRETTTTTNANPPQVNQPRMRAPSSAQSDLVGSFLQTLFHPNVPR